MEPPSSCAPLLTLPHPPRARCDTIGFTLIQTSNLMRHCTAVIALMIVTGFARSDPPDTDAPGADAVKPSQTCTTGCGGRADGYAWAEQKDVDDVDDCVGPSTAFVEGCRAYVEENHPSVYNGDGRF